MWIDIRQRMPTAEDADETGCVLWRNKRGVTYRNAWSCESILHVAWLKIPPYTPLPEIPEGYRLLRTDEYSQRQNSKAMYLMAGSKWRPISLAEDSYYENSTYIVPIEPEQQYRPFRDAAEFRPYRDRWWRFKGSTELRPPSTYSYHGLQGRSWANAFSDLEFEDGIPFGIEVTDE